MLVEVDTFSNGECSSVMVSATMRRTSPRPHRSVHGACEFLVPRSHRVAGKCREPRPGKGDFRVTRFICGPVVEWSCPQDTFHCAVSIRETYSVRISSARRVASSVFFGCGCW